MAAELRFGTHMLGAKTLTGHVDDLLASLPVLPLDAGADRTDRDTRPRLERAGTPIGPNDLLIAAQALKFGLILVAGNLDKFMRVAGLPVEILVEQPGVRGAIIRTNGIRTLPSQHSALSLPDDSNVANPPSGFAMLVRLEAVLKPPIGHWRHLQTQSLRDEAASEKGHCRDGARQAV